MVKGRKERKCRGKKEGWKASRSKGAGLLMAWDHRIGWLVGLVSVSVKCLQVPKGLGEPVSDAGC